MLESRLRLTLMSVIALFVLSSPATLFAGTPTIADARYDVRTKGERLDVVVTLQLRQSDENTGRLSLDLADLSLKTATLDGKPAAVHRDRKQPSRLIIACSAKKRSTLQLRMSTKMRSIGHDFETRLPLIADAPATIRATVPAKQSLLVGGTQLPRKAAIDQSNVYTFPAGNHRFAQLRFTTGADSRKTDAVLLATSAIELFVTTDGVRWQSETTIDAVGKNQKTLLLKLPARLKITKTIADGSINPTIFVNGSDDGETVIKWHFAQPKARRVVRLSGLIAPGTEPIWNVPNLTIVGADGHAGRIVVRSDASLKLRVDEFAGVSERILPKQTGNVVPASATQDRVENSTRRLGFEFWKQDFELALAIPKRRDEMAINTNAVVTIHEKTASLAVKTTCIRGEIPQKLRLNIPAGWTGFRVRCNGRPIRWKLEPFEAGMQRIVVSMPKRLVGVQASAGPVVRRPAIQRTTGNLQVELQQKSANALLPKITIDATHQLAADNESGARELPLPVIRCDDATLTNGRIALRAAQSQHLAGTGLQRMRTVASKISDDRITYAYTLRPGDDAKPHGTLKIRRGSRTPSVASLVWYSKQNEKLRTRQLMQITPAEVGVSQFKVNVKARSLEDVAFRCLKKGRRMTATRESNIGGQQAWRLTFIPPLTKPTLLEASITAGLQSEPSTPPLVRIEDVEVTSTHIALAGSNRHWLTIHATRKEEKKNQAQQSTTYSLQRVLPRDLAAWMRKQITQVGGDSAVRVYRQPSASYALHLRSNQPTTQADAVRVEQLRLDAQLTAAGVIRATAKFTIHGTAGRQLRIQLPEGATLKRIRINGRTNQVSRRADADGLVLPIDRKSVRRIVELHYTAHVGRLSGVRTITPKLPTVHVGNDKTVPVLQAECLLHLPAGVTAVAADGSFEAQSTLNSTSWLSTDFGGDDSASVIHLRHITVDDAAPQLSLTIAESTGGLRLRLAVLLAFALVLWRLRKLPLRYRGLTAVIATAAAAVLALWAPAAWVPCLDGIFFGTLLGSALWALPTVCSQLSAACGRLRSIRPTHKLLRPTTVGIAVAILFGPTNNGVAADTDAMVSSAKFEIRISAKTATVDADYRIHNSQTAPVTVAVPLGRVALASAELNGKPTDVTWRADKAKNLLLHVPVSEKGWNRLSLEFSLPIKRQAGGRVLHLPTYPVAAGTAAVHLDDPSLQVIVPDLRGALKKNGGRVEFAVDGMTGVEMQLLSAATAKKRRGIVESQATTELTISDHGVMQRDRFRLRMRSGAMNRMTFDIPAGRKLLGVEGVNIAGWDVLLVGDAGYAVMVDFKRPVRSTTSLTFRTFKPVNITSEPTAFAFDRVTPTTATTIAETVNVVADADLAVSESDVRQALRIAPSRVRRVNTGNNATRLAYRLTSPDSKVTFKISRPGSKVRVVSQHQAYIGTHAVRYSSKMRFHIAGRPKSRFALFLPEGFQLQSLTGDNSVEWSFGEDKTMLNVTFPKPQTGRVAIAIKGAMPRSGSSPTAEVSIPSAMMANTVENSVSVTAAPVYRIAPGEIEGWKPANGDGALNFYSTDVEAAPVGIQLTPRVDGREATLWTYIEPTLDGVNYTIAMHWAASSASKRLVAFDVPAWLRSHIRVDMKGRPGQVVQRDPKTIPEDSPQRWFVLQNSQTKFGVTVTAKAILPWSLADRNTFRAPLLTMATAKHSIDIDDAVSSDFDTVESAKRYAILIQPEASLMRIQLPKKNVSQIIDPQDVPGDPGVDDGLLWVKTIGQGICYQLNPTKDEPVFKRVDTPLPLNADSIPRGVLKTVIQSDGRYRTTAIYKVRNHSRRFVAVVLPDDAATSSFTVNGKPTHGLVETHNGTSFTLIPIPRSVAEDPIPVQVTWTGRLPHEVSRRNWILPAARIVTSAESRQHGLQVGSTVWRVELPPGMTGDALDDPNQMNLVSIGESFSGRILTLQKPGGQPRMALSVRSEAAVQTGVSFFASLVWLTAAAFVCAAVWKLRPAKTQAS